MKGKDKEKTFCKKIKFNSKNYDIFLRSDADESVAAEIFDWREYRAAEEIIRESRLPVIDAGAHIGIFTLYVRALNPVAVVYALEPENENFNLLKKNIMKNKISGVKISNVALAGKSGERSLLLSPDSINHRLLEDAYAEEKDKAAKVQAVSLDDFLDRNGIVKAGLLKMDIEGGEFEVLESASEKSLEKIAAIILEYHDGDNRNHSEIENIMRCGGFGVQSFPSRFDNRLGFMLARNKRNI